MKLDLSNGINPPPFALADLKEGRKQLKPYKTAGIDGIPNEILEHFTPTVPQWLLSLLNSCLRKQRIPME